ncbi:hypothetical protein N0X72_18800 [Streptomyces carpaticus]|uniref:DUF4352 domain-containing protein n=1 Tax=Streptomyces harbinensis TaxID=1176198 RepID=A0A1I6TXU9_9ACTN|nr:hypothetical protein [Streptomyces harbinensis]QKV70451.1 hypothetical protein HUT13_18030 [Streptomyces harbinensis]UWM50881.1 hypothetical protein N0X72_18800 [Streptomyces carpaticus]SFS93995.1 hypothetical protein SAMN05444716_10574 [Streptomyces harbinensis]
MDLRDSKSRLILIVVALGAALVIAVASCSGGGGDDDNAGTGGDDTAQSSGGGAGDGGGEQDDAPGDDAPDDSGSTEVLAESTGEGGITLTFTRAQREAGGFLTVEGTIRNDSSETWFDVGWAGPERELRDNAFSMAGSSLVAAEEGKRYLILRDTSGRCLCTGFGPGIPQGETVEWFAQFPEPDPATTEVQFQIGNMPPATLEIR